MKHITMKYEFRDIGNTALIQRSQSVALRLMVIPPSVFEKHHTVRPAADGPIRPCSPADGRHGRYDRSGNEVTMYGDGAMIGVLSKHVDCDDATWLVML